MREITTEDVLAKAPEVIVVPLGGSTAPFEKKRGRPVGSLSLSEVGKARMAKRRKQHSEEDRIKAATVYAITGKASETERITGIPALTIRQWKTKEWWPRIIERIREEKDDEFDVKFTQIVDKTVTQLNDRLDNGDYVYDNHTGQLIRQPIKGKDLGVITSIYVDKRELLRGKATVTLDQASMKDRLDRIADDVRRLAAGSANIIEGEIIAKETESVSQAHPA